MTTSTYFIAQLNVARALAPMEDPVMAGFMNQLDEINALAERSAGFVWRLQDENNNATSIQIFDELLIIINMSVWETIEELHQYTYYTAHAAVFRQRAEWFKKFGQPHLVLWWVPADHRPTPQEGRLRLEHLQQNGPSSQAFTFKKRFTHPQQETTKLL